MKESAYTSTGRLLSSRWLVHVSQYNLGVVRLDLLDAKIVSELYRNGRISYRELAKRVELSTTGVMKRVDSLMKAGTLREFVVMPSHAMIGAERFRAIVHTDGYENEEHFVNSIGGLPEVQDVVRLVSARGGSYYVLGNYIGSIRLNEIGRYLRTLTHVEDVELHSVVANWSRVANWGRGEKMELSKHHLLILRALRGNPRIQVKELSDETGLSMRRVRRLLRDIEDSGAFYFFPRTGPIVEGPTFVVRIRLAEDEMSPEQLLDWLRDAYQEHLYSLTISVTEPVLFALIVGVDVPKMSRILREVGRSPLVSTATLMMYLTYTSYPYLNQLKLNEMLKGLDDGNNERESESRS